MEELEGYRLNYEVSDLTKLVRHALLAAIMELDADADTFGPFMPCRLRAPGQDHHRELRMSVVWVVSSYGNLHALTSISRTDGLYAFIDMASPGPNEATIFKLDENEHLVFDWASLSFKPEMLE